MKRICHKSLALLLVLAMLLTLVPATYASEGTPEIKVGSETVDASANSTVTVPVEIKNNPGFAGMDLTFTGMDGWEITKFAWRTQSEYSIFYSEDEYGDKSLFVTPTVNPAAGKFVVAYHEQIESSGYLCWITLKLPEGAVNGDYDFAVTPVKINTATDTITDISSSFTFTSGAITVTGGVPEENVTPVITTQPVGASYTYAQPAPTVSPLTVEASVAQDGGTLSYQWYCGGQPIEDATESSYTPALPALGESAHYFCLVTYTYQGRTYQKNSDMATITYNMAEQQTLRFTNVSSVTYGDTLTLTTEGGSGDGEISYAIVEGDENATLEGNVLTPLKTGSVTVQATKASDGGYEKTTASQTITIQPAALVLDGSGSYDVAVYTTKKPVALPVPTVEAKNGQSIEKTWQITSGKDVITLDTDTATVTARDGAAAGAVATVTLTYSAQNHTDAVVTYHITVCDKADVSDKLIFTAKDVTAVYNWELWYASYFVNEAKMDGDYTGEILYELTDSDGVKSASKELNELRVVEAGVHTITAIYSDDTSEGRKTLTFEIERAKVDKPTAISGLYYTGKLQDGVAYNDEDNAGYEMTGTLQAREAGSYTATATLDQNHMWSDGSLGTLTVNWSIAQAEIDVSDYAWDYTDPIPYDGQKHAVAIRNADETVEITLGGSYEAVNAGNYTATASAAAKDSKNYVVIGSIAPCAWQIVPAGIDVSGVKFEQSDIVYDGEAHTVSVTGLPAHVSVSYDGVYTATDAGNYTASAALCADSDNYVLNGTILLTLNWNILRAAVASEPAAISGLVYSGTAQNGVEYAENVGYTISGDLTATNAGSYCATAALDSNHSWIDGSTNEKTISWSIARKSVALAAQSNSLRYSNTAEQTYTAAQLLALLNDSNADTTLTITDVTTGANSILAADAELKNGAVSYALASNLSSADKDKTAVLTISYESNNYASSTLELIVKVMDKIDISASIVYEDGSSVYDGTVKTHETAQHSGFTPSANGHWSYTSARDGQKSELKDAGTYLVTATYEDDDHFGSATATYTISAAALTITGAKAADKTYDGTTAASVTDVTFSGLVSGESVSYTVSSAAFETADAGTDKTVRFTVALNETNYALATATAKTKGTVKAKPVTVTLGSIADLTYTGSALTPTVTVTAEDTVNGDTLTEKRDYTVSYANNLNAGTASVKVLSLAGSNYCFDPAETSFTILRAAVATLYAEPMVITYTGQAIPVSSITGTAFFNGAEVSGAWSWVREPASVNASEEPYPARVSFTPDNANLIGAECDLLVTICKATPTGEPSYTKLMSADKTLADAQLGTGTIKPDGGVIFWVDENGNALPDDTKAEPFVAYNWLYIPVDTVNYHTLGGSLIPCEYQTGSATKRYRVTVAETENGTVSTRTTSAAEGETVYFTAAAHEGYILGSITAETRAGDALVLTEHGSGRYSFSMPADSVMIRAEFVHAESEPVISFTDVPDDAWYHDAVRWAVENGITIGISDTTFAPELVCDRGQVVTFLYRAVGSPAHVETESRFADVAEDSYCYDAVLWAVKNGITTGVGDGSCFAPDITCDRAQIVTFLYRFMQMRGEDVSIGEDTNLLSFADALDIPDYAFEAMQWACGAGVMQGDGVNLMPTKECTRAEIVTLLYRTLAK